MIETVRTFGEVARGADFTLNEDRWLHLRSRMGPRYVLRAEHLPAGLSEVSYQRVGGDLRWTAEGNITTALYGPEAKAGSLTPPEVHRAVEAFTEVALGASERPVPSARGLRVSRFDPSQSYVLGPTASPADVVGALHLYLWPKRSDRLPIHLIGTSGDTLAWGKRGGDAFHRVYDKSAESAKAGGRCPPNTLRVEIERRPRTPTYLDEVELMMDITDKDLEQVAQYMAESVAEYTKVSVAALLEGQKRLGEKEDHAEALRLSGAMSVIATEGINGLMGLGISRRTAYRINQRVEQLMTASVDGEVYNATAQALRDATKLLAREVVLSDAGY